MVDLITMTAVHYESLEVTKDIPIPETMADDVETARTALIEAVAEREEALLEKYLAGEEIAEEDIRRVLRAGVIANEVQPVFCGSALRDKGIQRICDGMIDYLPSPVDLPPTEVTDDEGQELSREVDDDAPLTALAFKTIHDRTGDLTF
ncbi:MAG: elongation factor G, partial [Planctomycetota bacterium]